MRRDSMGRAQLQGAPWHYEYLQCKTKKKNSKNCAFNTGVKCTCKISINHGKVCVGENECDEFERGNPKRANICQNDRKYQEHKKRQSYQNSKTTVVRGDIVFVEEIATHEIIDFKVNDVKNPFYMKSIGDIVLIKCEQYKIVELRKH